MTFSYCNGRSLVYGLGVEFRKKVYAPDGHRKIMKPMACLTIYVLTLTTAEPVEKPVILNMSGAGTL